MIWYSCNIRKNVLSPFLTMMILYDHIAHSYCMQQLFMWQMTTNHTTAVIQTSPLFYPKSFTRAILFSSHRWRRSCISCRSPRRERRLEFSAPGSGQAWRWEPAGDEQEAAEHAGRTTHQEHASTEGVVRGVTDSTGKIVYCYPWRHRYDIIIHNTVVYHIRITI